MWTVQGTDCDPSRFSPLCADEVLYEFDGPRIFTAHDSDHALCLACWSDGDETLTRYIVAPSSARIVDSLRSGALTVADALDQPRCWVCDVLPDGSAARCTLVEFGEIPEDARPAVGTMLLPELEPLFAVRVLGPGVVPGQVPGSTLRDCVGRVQSAFKTLLEFVRGSASRTGRPTGPLARLYDLPVRRLAFASLDISFGPPLEGPSVLGTLAEATPTDQELAQVGSLLRRGLRWLTTSAADEGIYSPANPDESAAILGALDRLTRIVGTAGTDRVELRGSLLGSQRSPIALERSTRRRVLAAKRTQGTQSEALQLCGRVRELDKDKLSFELRETRTSPPAQRFVFDQDLMGAVLDALQADRRVRVCGHAFAGRKSAYAVSLDGDIPPLP